MPLKRWMFEAAAIVIAVSMLGYMLWLLSGARAMTLPSGQPLFGDFIAFWSAGRAALEGHVAEIHQRAVLFPYQQLASPGVQFYAPWNSPPTFLLVACVLALAPYPVSAIAFLIATLALFLFAARKLLPDTRALIFPATAPAVIYHAGTAQAGLLIAGISGLALHWLDRRPRLAGALVALLAIKPHLAILWPLLLALSGRWRAFAAAAVSTLVFSIVAGFVFGFDTYLRFLDNLAHSQRLISSQLITTPAYASLYANLLGLGVGEGMAIITHYASAAAAVAIAALLFRNADRAVAGAAFCAATLLVSPYLFFYDFTLLLMGAALLGPPRNALDTFAAVLAWGAGLTVAIGAYVSLPLCPLAAWVVLMAAFRRARIVASHPARVQRT